MSNPETSVANKDVAPLILSQDFEYLIRRELDIEHSPATLCRKSNR